MKSRTIDLLNFPMGHLRLLHGTLELLVLNITIQKPELKPWIVGLADWQLRFLGSFFHKWESSLNYKSWVYYNFHDLQHYNQQFQEVGPLSRLQKRFKTKSSVTGKPQGSFLVSEGWHLCTMSMTSAKPVTCHHFTKWQMSHWFLQIVRQFLKPRKKSMARQLASRIFWKPSSVFCDLSTCQKNRLVGLVGLGLGWLQDRFTALLILWASFWCFFSKKNNTFPPSDQRMIREMLPAQRLLSAGNFQPVFLPGKKKMKAHGSCRVLPLIHCGEDIYRGHYRDHDTLQYWITF